MPKKQIARQQNINPTEMLSPPIVLKSIKEKQQGKQQGKHENKYVQLDSEFLKSFFTM
jgi:hypothetical protein